MNSIEIFLALFSLITIAAAIAPRLKLPVEIILLVGSLAISFIPGLPKIDFQPHIIFVLFLPPILFSAAYLTSWRDFKANVRPISLLAVGLVLFTTLSIGVAVKLLIPNFSWPMSFLLGAIISPPDASAAVALTKKFGIPKKIITIIEGESLLNDATALIAYRVALTAIGVGTFSLWQAGLDFALISGGGLLIGYFVGFIGSRLFVQLKEGIAQNMVTLLIPYTAYLSAEQLKVSGIISVVTAGLYFARKAPFITRPETRHKANAIWEIYLFIINGLIFTLIGLQLPTIIKHLVSYSAWQLFEYVFVCTLLLILIRFLWVFPTAYLPRWFSQSLRKRDPMPHWSALLITSWIGMRGIISLAAAMSLPLFIYPGVNFPQRDLLIFLTYSVILITLLLPALTLPLLIKFLKIKDDNLIYKEEVQARIIIAEAVLKELENFQLKQTYSLELIKLYHRRYYRQISILKSNLQEEPFSELFEEDQTIRKLTKHLIKIEYQILLDLLARGVINDEVFHIIQKEIDIEDMQIKTYLSP